ncbi:MAG: insulinase family protein [Planctomycetes bacterium]|nr:insulinase family protein [Planctomycetota bacterium]
MRPTTRSLNRTPEVRAAGCETRRAARGLACAGATFAAMALCALAGAALAAAASPASAPEPPRPGERIETLDNGLRVIVKERHLGGAAAFRIYVAAGALNEGEYAGAGISHLLEHVVSGGATPTRTEEQIQGALAAIGAQTNAHTSKQFVCYFGETSAEHVGRLIEIIGDYVANNLIEAQAFEREFEVVQRELERAEADPDHRLWRLADETFFPGHPARMPVIGHLANLRQLKHEDLVRFYRARVTPDNSAAVAVGDFDAAAVLEKVRQVLGKWQRRPGAPPVLPPRERQVAPREAAAEMDVASVRTIIEFPSVQLTHPDLYPLDILAFILGEGRASRLVADLRDKRGLVESVSCASYTPAGYDGGRFLVVYQADPARAAAARQAVLEHLARAAKEKPSADELARAKRQKISEHVFGLQKCEDIAEDMGTNMLLVGAPHFSERYVRNIQGVTADDVQRAAAKYVRPEMLCVTSVGPKAAAKPPEARPAPAAAQAGRPQVIARVLGNGVRLLLCPVEGHPGVSIQMFMRGGLSVETEAEAGISSFMARMLLKGTPRRRAADVAQALDAMGAEMTASAGRNTLYVSARCLSEDFEKTFDLAADCLLRPAFPQDELQRLRELVLAELAHMEDTPHGEAQLYFHRVFFQDSPYRFPVQGTPDSVKTLTRERLQAWHKKYVAGNNLVVAVFGGIDLVKAAHYAAGAVESLPPNKDLAFPKDVAPREVKAREVHVKPSQKGAAVVYVAYPGMDIYNVRDRYAMDVLDTVVSGYQMPGGRLHEELRGKGLVYEVHAFSMEGQRPGYFAAMAVCRPEKAAEVARIIEGHMQRAAREGFTEEQLAPARATIVTAMELGRETVDAAAFEAAVDEALGLGYEFPREEIQRVRQVRPEDVARVARQYLKAPVVCIVTSDPAAAEAVRK